jgi:TatD DNase family protein
LPDLALIDSHCHLDHFDQPGLVMRAAWQQHRIIHWVVPATNIHSFAPIEQLKKDYPSHISMALGLHPCYLHSIEDLAFLTQHLHRADQDCVALGEIGLDFLDSPLPREEQEIFFSQQLLLAKKLGLPVILHVRKAHARVHFYLKKYHIQRGLVHAFSGSLEEAKNYLDHGFKLGLGGTLSYAGSKRIRRAVQQLPLSSWVLETDAPYMHPSYVDPSQPNKPGVLRDYVRILSDLTGYSPQDILHTHHQQLHTALGIDVDKISKNTAEDWRQ